MQLSLWLLLMAKNNEIEMKTYFPTLTWELKSYCQTTVKFQLGVKIKGWIAIFIFIEGLHFEISVYNHASIPLVGIPHANDSLSLLHPFNYHITVVWLRHDQRNERWKRKRGSWQLSNRDNKSTVQNNSSNIQVELWWIEPMVMGVHGHYYWEEGSVLTSFEKISGKVSFNTMSSTT